MINLKEQLNCSQYEAVRTINRPVLVIAGAGSGKTRVIEYKVLYLIQNNFSPSSILLLTFTRKSAEEMLSRAGKHDPRCTEVEGGTFHSFCFKILKRYSRIIGISNSFIILDEGDAEDLLKKCASELKFFNKEKKTPNKRTLRKIISMSINKDMTIKKVIQRYYPYYIEFSEDIGKIREKYFEYKINKNYLDYDDLLIYMKVLLEDEGFRNMISERYRYIMVDEYQDTNKLQGDITYYLAERHKNITVVGDDAQSIYNFRGASHENIMKFPNLFPECKIVRLEKNYRSTQAILNLANSVLENMENKYPKCLISANRKKGNKPLLLFFKNANEEAEWIANEIMYLRNEGIPLSKQAVLFRSGYVSLSIQAELNKRNIPYKYIGGIKFTETSHFKDIVSYFRVFINPKDELAWYRILNIIEGIGSKTSEKILNDIFKYSQMDDILENSFSKYLKKFKFSDDLQDLINVLKEVNFRNKKSNIEEIYDLVYQYYKPFLEKRYDDWPSRNEDLITLKQIISRYDSIENFLNDFALEPPQKSLILTKSVKLDEKPLTLSTIHSAKGLEWEVVFIISAIDGVIPSKYSLNYQDELEEEHRLLYVAITRAKSKLYISFHHDIDFAQGDRFNKLSRFLKASNVLKNLCEKEAKLRVIKNKTLERDKENSLRYNKKSLIKKIMDIFK